MEDFSMSDRILRTIANIIDNDSELLDFTVVRTEGNTRNKSPVLYEEHHLALESWCIKYIYRHVCSDLFKVRELVKNRKLPYPRMEEINYLLIGALLISPDVPTFWNMKRELVECDILNANKELQFSKIVLTYKGKCNEAFAYRRWIIGRIIEKMTKNNVQVPLNLFESELNVVNLAAESSPNNYHAWTHRIWCIESMIKIYPEMTKNIVQSQLEYAHKWVENHISEHSGFHFIEYLIDLVKKNKNITSNLSLYYDYVVKQLNIVNDGGTNDFLIFLLGKQYKIMLEEQCNYTNYISLLLYELINIIETLNSCFPEHEALWYHRRYVVFNLIKITYEYHSIEFKNNKKITVETSHVGNVANSKYLNGEKEAKIFKGQVNQAESSNLYEIVLGAEKKFVGKYSRSELSRKYENWLKYVLGIDL